MANIGNQPSVERRMMARHDWEHLESWWLNERIEKGVDRCRKCGLEIAYVFPDKPPRKGCPIKQPALKGEYDGENS